jgi:hypothetical protein
MAAERCPRPVVVPFIPTFRPAYLAACALGVPITRVADPRSLEIGRRQEKMRIKSLDSVAGLASK